MTQPPISQSFSFSCAWTGAERAPALCSARTISRAHTYAWIRSGVRVRARARARVVCSKDVGGLCLSTAYL